MALVKERENLDGLLPDWDDAPEWAMWCAQNWSGKWMWFEKMPHHWDKDSCWYTRTGKSKVAGYGLLSNPEWRTTIYKKPEDGH